MHRVQHYGFVTNFLKISGIVSLLVCSVIVIVMCLTLESVFRKPSDHKADETAGGLLVAVVLFLFFATFSAFSFVSYSFIGP